MNFCYCISQNKLGFAEMTKENESHKSQRLEKWKVISLPCITSMGAWLTVIPTRPSKPRPGAPVNLYFHKHQVRGEMLATFALAVKTFSHNGTPSQLTYSHFIGQSKALGYTRPLGE